MDTLTRGPEVSSPNRQDEFLPAESPMAMTTQALRDFSGRNRFDGTGLTPVLLRRAYILLGTAALTMVGCYEMYDVLKVGGVTLL
jgi:membrane glycosyltransferase